MVQKIKGLEKLNALWCVWFALLMGAPYPAGMGDTWFIAVGAAAESKVFAYVASAVVAGLWVGTLPRVERVLVIRRSVCAVVWAIGVALSAVTMLAVWLNLIFTLFCVPDFAFSWTAVILSGAEPLPLMTIVYHLGNLPAWSALASGFLCGLSAVGTFHERSGSGAGQSSASPRTARVATCLALSFLLGLLQQQGWVLLMPHDTEFPQVLPGIDPVSKEWGGAVRFPWLFGIVLPTALSLAFALIACRRFGAVEGSSAFAGQKASVSVAGHCGLTLVAALCSGIVFFRVIARLVPDLIRISFPAAAAGTALYLFAFVCFCLLAWDSPTAQSPVGADVRDVAAGEIAVPTEEVEVFAFFGLTQKELLAVRAYELGMTAAQAGAAMGIAESTVREYRRRARVKMGVGSMDEAVALVRGRVGSPAAEPGKRDLSPIAGPASVSALSQVSLVSLCAYCSLLLFPIEGAVTVWSDVWTTGFGIAFGLIAAWGVLVAVEEARALSSGHALPLAIALVLALAASSALIGAMQLGLLSRLPEYLHRVSYFAGLGAATCAAVVTFCVLAWVARWECVDARGCLASSTVICLALVAGGAGHGVWALVLGASILALASSLLVLSKVEGCENGKSPAELPTRGFAGTGDMSWMVTCGLAMWTLGELWRSQAYESSVQLLQWVVVILTVVLAVRLLSSGAVEVPQLACVAIVFVTACASRGVAVAAVASFVLLGICSSSSRQSHPVIARGYAWHSPLLAGSFFLAMGTIATNYAGAVSLGEVARSLAIAYGSGLLVGAAILVILAFAVVLVVWEWTSGKEVSLSLEGESRARSALMARGLSGPQADIVLMLAAGLSVGDVASEMSYSRSTVALARREAYAALGVADRASLVVALVALSGERPTRENAM